MSKRKKVGGGKARAVDLWRDRVRRSGDGLGFAETFDDKKQTGRRNRRTREVGSQQNLTTKQGWREGRRRGREMEEDG